MNSNTPPNKILKIPMKKNNHVREQIKQKEKESTTIIAVAMILYRWHKVLPSIQFLKESYSIPVVDFIYSC